MSSLFTLKIPTISGLEEPGWCTYLTEKSENVDTNYCKHKFPSQKLDTNSLSSRNYDCKTYLCFMIPKFSEP